jgi:putative endonuclease
MRKKRKIQKNFYIYILECNDKTFYCGSTYDLDKRLHSHNHLKSAAKYTRTRRPVVLKYFEKVKSFAEMRKREAEIKRLTRKEKETLVSDI